MVPSTQLDTQRMEKKNTSIKQEGFYQLGLAELQPGEKPGFSILVLMWLVMYIRICVSHPSVQEQGAFNLPEPHCIYWAKL